MTHKAAAIWVGISAALMVVGAIGPWATAFGVLSVAGTDGDGLFALIAGLVIGAMTLLRYYRGLGAWTIVVGLLAASIAAAVSIYDMVNIQSEISNSHGLVTIGWGLWVDCIASVSAIVALYRFWRSPSVLRPTPQPPVAPTA